MPTTRTTHILSPLAQMMLIGGGFVLIVAGMRAAAEIINIVLLAFVITLLAAPVYRRLIAWRIPAFVAVVLVLLLFVAVLVLLGAFMAVSLSQLEANLLQYEVELKEKVLELIDWSSTSEIDLSSVIPTSGSFDFQSIIGKGFGFVGGILSSFARLFSNMGLVVLIVFFALFEVTAVPERLAQGMGEKHSVLQRFQRMNQSIRTYFGIKTLAGLITAAANTILLLALGVEFAFLWGILSFIFNFIPNIGFLIALIPAALFALLQFGVGKMLIVVVGYVVINFLIDNILSPRLMGRGLNLSPMIVFIALIFWSWVLGILGAILAVPFMIIVKTILESDENVRWLSLIVGETAPVSSLPAEGLAEGAE